MKILDKEMAVNEYMKIQGYENDIPEADEGIYEVLFSFNKKNEITKDEIVGITKKYGKEKDYKNYNLNDLDEKTIKEILKKAEEKDKENHTKRMNENR